MVDTGDLVVTLRDGRMVLHMPTDILFDSGEVDIKPRGQKSLATLAHVLTSLPGRRFQVAGHTDDDELDPVASNSDPTGRVHNRRIEITSPPNVDALVDAPTTC